MTDMKNGRLLLISICLLLWSTLALAAPSMSAPRPLAATSPTPPMQRSLADLLGVRSAPRLAPDCSDGIHYDDGTFEDAVSAPVAGGLQVMSFTLPANAISIQQVCVALTRLSAAPTSLSFSVVFYAADGPGGTPGSLLGSVPATASAIPASTSNINAQFYPVAIGSALTLPAARQIYVGVEFDGSEGFFVAVDNSAATALQPSYASTDGGASWQSEPTVDPDPYKAFGIRVDPQLTNTNCLASSTAMCLQADRFKVSAAFQTADAAGTAEAVQMTSDTGYLWFFASTNVEVVIKVLDACALNQHFWVFAGGLTNVHTAITVTDTQTNTSKVYNNALNTPFQPLQDTSAFPCP